jgi:hypothetical protein
MPISLSGSLNLSGSLTTTGTITSTTLVVQTITSSISSITGSTNFGSLSSNTHVFTGSMYVTGAFYVTTGSVGIGTTSPGQKLHIVASSNPYIRIDDTSVNSEGGLIMQPTGYNAKGGLTLNFSNGEFKMFTGETGNGYLQTFYTNGVERMRIGSTGNVGIGTTNLIYSTLNIKASGTALYNGISIYSTNGTETFLGMGNTGTDCGFFATYGATGAYIPITFSTNGGEKMRITTDGYTKMSANGTYALSTGYYHEFYGGAANGYTLIVTSPVATPLSQYIFDIRFSAATPNNTSARFLHCNDATATRAIIRSNGGLANYQSNNADLSDIRTKKDIVSLESYWNKFKALEIVKYKYKDQTHDDFNIGVIAQQVEEVAPEFVDVDGWSKNDIESESPLKSIYTKDLYHATIKVLQEAMVKIETLEARVQYLENK